MKTSFRHLLIGASVSLFCALTLAVFAQDNPPPVLPPASAAESPSSEGGKAAAPADESPPAVAPAPAAEVEKTAETEKPLRRLDRSTGGGGAKTEKTTPAKRSREVRARSGTHEFPMGDHHVAKGGRVNEVVSIMGATRVEGEVVFDAVSVLGLTTIGPEGKVGGDAVAVLGALKSQGSIGKDAVGVLGGVEIDGPVRGEVVSVLGDVRLGPNAVVERDLVLVGGKLTKDPAAIVRGNQVHVPIFGSIGDTGWLATWVKRCVLFARPLAFGENLGWAWLVALSFLAFYAALALLFRPGIEKCVTTFESRPGWSVLAAVLTVLLSPVVLVLLVATVVGLLIVPFVGVGLMLVALFGKAVMLAWLGRRITRFFGEGPWSHPAFAVLVGGAVVLLLYTVPVFGFVLFKVLSWLGVGVVVYTIVLGMKWERPPVVVGPAPATPSAASAASVASAAAVTAAPVVPPVGAPSAVSPGFTGTPGGSGARLAEPAAFGGLAAGSGESAPGVSSPPLPLPAPAVAGAAPIISASTLPRAGFWIRLAALALDGILLGMLVGFTSSLLPRFLQFDHGPGGVLVALAAYGAVMWKHRGTTIGGIVCGLKVVRLDHRELDWATACVRALGCFLSLFVAGLGFIWVVFDEEKQSWHDKIAGTTVVRVPKGVSLL